MNKIFTPRFQCIRTAIALALFLLVQQARCQNLVADSSFEHNNGVPTLLSSIGLSSTWSSPSRGTTDLFCECNKKLKETSEAQTPANPMGTQKPYTGKCYAGIYAFSHGDYREYLLTQLTAPLEAGLKYELIFYLSLSDYSRAAIDRFGACFLNTAVKYDHSDVIQGLKPVYAKISDEIGTDTTDWHQVSIEYKARGGEQFLLLGSFAVGDVVATDARPPRGVRTRINQKTDRDAYYYVDAVSLRQVTPPPVFAAFTATEAPVKDTVKSPPMVVADSAAREAPTVTLDQPVVLKNVLFETSEALLLPSSFAELDVTANHLMLHPDIKIEVHGYTDNVGSPVQNLKLSERRAKAVADYLIAKSIDPARITYKGHGSENPIAANDTDEGRRQNRRVELVFRK